MQKYRVFEVSDENYKLMGKINLKLDDEEKDIMQKLRELGMKLNRHRNKIIWWDDMYVEIIQKKSDKTVGFMEIAYGG